jgi:FKBP-type peptidyl-prolyl cis-trans isomerase FklB
MHFGSAVMMITLFASAISFAQTELNQEELDAKKVIEEGYKIKLARQEEAQWAAEAEKTRAEKNKKAGEAFLAENKTKEGVVTLPSGLQYKILRHGDGPVPTETDIVEINYRGTLINNSEFDSSARHQRSSILAINRVIRGWQEALTLMPVGSKWRLFVPPDLAYGEKGFLAVEPNAVVIFEIELVDILRSEKSKGRLPTNNPESR